MSKTKVNKIPKYDKIKGILTPYVSDACVAQFEMSSYAKALSLCKEVAFTGGPLLPVARNCTISTAMEIQYADYDSETKDKLIQRFSVYFSYFTADKEAIRKILSKYEKDIL